MKLRSTPLISKKLRRFQLMVPCQFQPAIHNHEKRYIMEGSKTLPASWYCSKNLYELERRAVFLRSWYLLGPIVRFAKEKKVDYEIAGIVIHVQNFSTEADEHFEVTDKARGTALPFYLTKTGLLFAAPSHEAPSFQSYFPDLEELTDKYDFRRLPHRRSIKYEGKFNWKTMVDGYQECLHCQYTHRSFSVLYPPTFYEVHNHHNYSRHIADPAKFEDGLFLYFFPICTFPNPIILTKPSHRNELMA